MMIDRATAVVVITTTAVGLAAILHTLTTAIAQIVSTR